ncbi:MAG: hypothetical protein RJA09_1940, partial [Pseudomonadota bacterium]
HYYSPVCLLGQTLKRCRPRLYQGAIPQVATPNLGPLGLLCSPERPPKGACYDSAKTPLADPVLADPAVCR